MGPAMASQDAYRGPVSLLKEAYEETESRGRLDAEGLLLQWRDLGLSSGKFRVGRYRRVCVCECWGLQMELYFWQ